MQHFVSTIHAGNNEMVYFLAKDWEDIRDTDKERFKPIACDPIEWKNTEEIDAFISEHGYAVGSKRGDQFTGFRMGTFWY
ncbi:hypothetical protein H9643_08250 [Ochrobactrum sp. Sa2BUA5]|nr:hypothetical protein [Ochrobactrum gallinarum]